MKKILVTFILILSMTNVHAQLTGAFKNMNDGHIYFVLTNNALYNVQVSWWVNNDATREQKNGSFILPARNTSLFGPSTIGWVWIKGERVTIVSQGLQTKWTCPSTDPSVRKGNPSFGGSEASKYNGRKCSYVKSNGKYCDCSGCSVGNWDAFTCSKCGHRSNLHTR